MAGAFVAVALGIEYVDELADGTKGAALPLIRGGLHLTYAQLGLLIAVPLLVGSLLELPLGLLAGTGRRRHRLILAGGLVVVVTLAAVAAAGSFLVLLVALTLFFPASGAFVGLIQSSLMDAAADRHERRMASWNLAGSIGAVTGPLLLAGWLLIGGTWRTAYLIVAAFAGVMLAAAAVLGPGDADVAAARPADLAPAGDSAHAAPDDRPDLREALGALRDLTVVRLLALLQISDLMLDVLTGFVGVYLVAVADATPAQAAVGVAVRLASGLAGDACTLIVLRWLPGRQLLRLSAVAALLMYPAFLLVPGLIPKIVVLAGLSLATAPWYPLQQAGLYSALPGRSGIVVFLSSAASMLGALGPLAVGFVAMRFGLGTALALLAVAPVAVVALS